MKFSQIKLFAISVLLTLLASMFNIFYPTISFMLAFFIYCYFTTQEFKIFCIFVSGILFDGFFNFNFGTCNLIFLSLALLDLLLKKTISINKKQINYFLFLIILAQGIFLLLNPVSQNFISYFIINSSLSFIYLIILIKYAK